MCEYKWSYFSIRCEYKQSSKFSIPGQRHILKKQVQNYAQFWLFDSSMLIYLIDCFMEKHVVKSII